MIKPMRKLYAIGIAFIMTISASVNAQKLSQEKVSELTGKSKNKGYLGNVVVDDTKQTFDLVFVTKSTNKKVKFEVYQYDYDFNLINNFSDEQEVSVARQKNKKMKYRGEDVEVYNGATAQGNLRGKLVLRKIQSIYTYNWWKGDYEIETHVLDKQKPKEMDSDGGDKKRKLFYTSHLDRKMEGSVLVCALVNKGIMGMSKSGGREYLIMDVDKDLNIVKKTPMNFDHPQSLLYSGEIEETNEWVMVFAPFGGQGYGKIADPDPTNLTYVRIDKSGNIKERFNFKTKCNEWGIFDMAISGNDVYLYGAGNINKPDKKYNVAPFTITNDAFPSPVTNEQRLQQLENSKFGHLQVVKIANGKAEFVSAVSMDDINAKGIKPPAQKKLKEFNGKKFILNGINITSNGDVFINGQDFSYDKVGEVKGRVYKDLLMFQFDKTGEFKKYYGVESTAKGRLLAGAGTAKSFPAESYIYESANGDLYWKIMMCQDIDIDCSTEYSYSWGGTTRTTTCTYTPLFQGKMAKLDADKGTISDINTFGGEDFYLYTDLGDDRGKDVPWFTINDGKQIIYVARSRKGGIKGNERWGNQIWFGKFDPNNQ